MPTRRFEFVEGTSSKFWEVWIEGTEVRTRYGRIGSSGQVTLKEAETADAAAKLSDKLIREKLGKGYRETTGPAAPSTATVLAPAYASLIAMVEKKAADAGVSLRDGASEEQILALEKLLGLRLPEDVRAFYRLHDGGGADCAADWRELLSLERIAEEWSVWKQLLDEGSFGANDDSEPTPGVQRRWWIPEWIPMTYDGSGNHHVVDLAPTTEGRHGQLLSFWHDGPERTVEGPSFLEWLALKAVFKSVDDGDEDEDEDEEWDPSELRTFAMDDKFWQIKLNGASHTVCFGKYGTAGREKTKEFANDADALEDYERLIAEKRKKGYRTVF